MAGADYKQIQIHEYVYFAIKDYFSFKDVLKPFSSASYPEGGPLRPDEGYMYTSWGIDKTDFPIIAEERSWDLGNKKNAVTKYWICVGVVDE